MCKSFHFYYIRTASIPSGRTSSFAVRLSAAQFKYVKLVDDFQEDGSQAHAG